MNHVWWRTHLRKLPELGFLSQFGNFGEVDDWMPFLIEALELQSGGRVLELGCGRGSYSIRLAQWGYQVTGVDESAPMLEVAQERAERRGVQVEFRHADLKSLPERSVFDGALILDFGTFSDADNAEMMRTVAAAIRPGGRVVFGTFNPYYWSREPRTDHRVIENADVIRQYTFDFPTGAVASRVRWVRSNGERLDLPEARYRAYTLPELRNLATATGLADLQVSGQDEGGRPAPGQGLDTLRTPHFYCVALRPVHGEGGEGI